MKRTPEAARLIAQTLIECKMNGTEAYRRLHPKASDATANANGGKLRKRPDVAVEVERLMSSGDNNAEKFIALQWKFLRLAEKELDEQGVVQPDKLQLSQTASRILAKGYIVERDGKDKQPAPSVSFGNIGADEIASMTESQTGANGAIAASVANVVKRVQ